MTTDERIAAIQTALAAVEHARELCNAAGIGGVAIVGQLTIAQVFDDIAKGAGAVVESAERQRPDIKIGDEITVSTGRGWGTATLVSIGPKYIGASRGSSRVTKYGRDNGGVPNWSQYHIHSDDLARINRCFPRKAGAK